MEKTRGEQRPMTQGTKLRSNQDNVWIMPSVFVPLRGLLSITEKKGNEREIAILEKSCC